MGAPPVRLGPVGPLSLALRAVEAVPSCRFVLSGPPCLVHTRHGLSRRVGPASSGRPFVGPVVGARETKRSRSGASARRDLARRVTVVVVNDKPSRAVRGLLVFSDVTPFSLHPWNRIAATLHRCDYARESRRAVPTSAIACDASSRARVASPPPGPIHADRECIFCARPSSSAEREERGDLCESS